MKEALTTKIVKNRNRQTKIIRQILQKGMIIVQLRITLYSNSICKPSRKTRSTDCIIKSKLSKRYIPCEREMSYKHWINMLNYAVWYFTDTVKSPILKKTESQLKFYDGASMKSVSKYSLFTKIKDRFFKLHFEIVSTKVSRNPLLSENTSYSNRDKWK